MCSKLFKGYDITVLHYILKFKQIKPYIIAKISNLNQADLSSDELKHQFQMYFSKNYIENRQ